MAALLPETARMRLIPRVVLGTLGALWMCVAAFADTPTGTTIDGIRCDQAEGAVFHIHQHLSIFDRGRPVVVPGDVGRPIVAQCFYWLHTHTTDGIIHVESPTFRTFTLGNFFDVWGEPLSASVAASAKMKRGRLRVFVDGRPFAGDPRTIELAQHTDVTLEAGPPYRPPVLFTDWKGQ
jgi:hypothetical protein